jgi:hypothetical protein
VTATALRVFDRPLPEALAKLRTAMAAAGATASSPDKLDPEGERMAAEDRKD